jgi:hypothetical protein
MSSPTIQAIHDFIRKYDHNGVGYFSHHERGQLGDYFDPETKWDMADVVCDCLEKTRRRVSIFLHGIDESDSRAIRAAEKLLNLPPGMKKRVPITISTDPFGPVNVPVEKAENVGRARSLQALKIFHDWPKLELRVYTSDYRKKVEELEKVYASFGEYMPKEVRVMQILQPTRVPLPEVNSHSVLEECSGYGIRVDGTIMFKQVAGPKGWSVIGSLTSLDPNQIQPVSHALT